MATIFEVEAKYCDRCQNRSSCYIPCPIVLAAINDLPCEQELLQMCKGKDDNNERA